MIGRYSFKDGKEEATEASWREERYQFLSQLNSPVITAHHLADAVEWWIFSALRGNPSLTPIVRNDIPVLRPFLLSDPQDLHTHFGEYPHIEDPSNQITHFTRNFIRHEMLHRAERVNPGIYTTIRNMYERDLDV